MREPTHELTNDKVVLKIMEILKEHGRTEQDLTRDLGLANGTFTKWKYNGSKSYYRYLKEIGEYLGVSPDYLTEGVDDLVNVATMTASEIKIIRMYRELDKERKETMMRIMSYCYESMKATNEKGGNY